MIRLAALVVTLFAVAAQGSEPHLRVIAPEAAVRAGPGDRFREVYRARRDEVLRVVERATVGYWFRVVLPDGTWGWILGDETIPFEVAPGAVPRTSTWERVRETLFAPSPISRAHVGMSFAAGALGGDGMYAFRPSVVLDDWLALEGHVAEAVGRDGALLVYGLDGQLLLWPDGPLVPFVCLGGGGATSFPKVNGVTQAQASQLALDAGGGAMLILRWRITLRFDVRNYTLFTADRTANRQEYSGGLSVYF
jgi:hypothetical protein